jgi:hypothetical protein
MYIILQLNLSTFLPSIVVQHINVEDKYDKHIQYFLNLCFNTVEPLEIIYKIENIDMKSRPIKRSEVHKIKIPISYDQCILYLIEFLYRDPKTGIYMTSPQGEWLHY